MNEFYSTNKINKSRKIMEAYNKIEFYHNEIVVKVITGLFSLTAHFIILSVFLLQYTIIGRRYINRIAMEFTAHDNP